VVLSAARAVADEALRCRATCRADVSRVEGALDGLGSATIAAFPASDGMVSYHAAFALLIAIHRTPYDDRTTDDALFRGHEGRHRLAASLAFRRISDFSCHRPILVPFCAPLRRRRSHTMHVRCQGRISMNRSTKQGKFKPIRFSHRSPTMTFESRTGIRLLLFAELLSVISHTMLQIPITPILFRISSYASIHPRSFARSRSVASGSCNSFRR
jgi:hypothetical protein